MNTEQTYTGNPTSTNPPATGQRFDPLAERYKALHEHVRQFAQQQDGGDIVEMLSDIFYEWLSMKIGHDTEEDLDPTKTYKISQLHLNQLFASQQLMTDLIRIRETWVTIERMEQERSQV